MKPSFFSVARKPKWVGGLAIAALVAITFSLLMQWQLARTFSVVGVSQEELAPVPLAELAGPGRIEPGSFDRLAKVEVVLDPTSTFIVADRLQLQGDSLVPGYWLVSNSFATVNSEPVSLTLALAFSEDRAELESAGAELTATDFQITGYVEPSEAPVPNDEPGILGSVSLAQLVNLYSSEPVASFPIYLIVTEGLDLEVAKIVIDIRSEAVEVNWLTAFYALEWAFFALVSFYLWWRLVKDERNRLDS